MCFLDKPTTSWASTKSDIILGCSRSTTPHSVSSTTQDGEIVAWFGGGDEVSQLQPHDETPSRLWVTLTHYPSAAHDSFLDYDFQISVIYSGLSLHPSLPSFIFSPLTSSFQIGPLFDPSNCFSTLFTASDRNVIKGDLGVPYRPSHTVPDFPLSHHRYVKPYRMVFWCSGKITTLSTFHSEHRDFDWWIFPVKSGGKCESKELCL